MDYKYSNLTDKIIKSFYKVYNTLGYGFLEKVYEKSFSLELQKAGLFVQSQIPIAVHYDNTNVGDYYADLIINEVIILELKAESAIHPMHEAQLLNYLKATDIELGYLFNFGQKPQFKRKLFENKFKNQLKSL